MTEIEYRVADLINFSSQQKPVEFDQAFQSLMVQKISNAVDAKKVAVAQKMFSDPQQEESEDDQADEAA